MNSKTDGQIKALVSMISLWLAWLGIGLMILMNLYSMRGSMVISFTSDVVGRYFYVQMLREKKSFEVE